MRRGLHGGFLFKQIKMHFMLKKTLSQLLLLLLLLFIVACNLSDYTESLPGGYIYAHEGGCLNTLLSYSKRLPGFSYLTDIAYNNEYICFANVDSTVCVNAKYSEKEKDFIVEEKDKRYYIIEIEKDTVIGPLKQNNFYQVLKQKKIPEKLFLREKHYD